MSLPELKNALNFLLERNEDPQFLEGMIEEAEAQQQNGLSCDDLTDEEVAGIELGLAELKAGQGRSHASVMERFRKWM